MSGPPNILFILIDDLGWRDLLCYGSGFYETPRIDELCARGMRFDHAAASCPVCSPTRASIMSGKYPARVGITQFGEGANVGHLGDVPYFHALPLTEYSLAEALRDGGYQTWHVGKWHLGSWRTEPRQHGFDVNVGGCGWGNPTHGYFSPYGFPRLRGEPVLEDGPDGEYLTDRLTDETLRLLRERDRSRPFFCNLWHYAVHTPMQAPADLVEKYRAKAERLGLDPAGDVETGEPMPSDPLNRMGVPVRRRRRQSDPVYAAMIENLDTNIGRVLDAVRDEGIEDETLMVFTSDNGGLAVDAQPVTCNAPLHEGKGWTYEGGTRVPLIVSWPGVVAAGSDCQEPCTSTDWYPTLLEAAGLPPQPQQHVDGTSLLPLLRGEPFTRGPIFWHYPHYSNHGNRPAGAVRDGDGKLIEHFEDGRLELFDLAADPGERHDRVHDHPERAATMHRALRAWREEVEALMPRPNPRWRRETLPADVHPAEV